MQPKASPGNKLSTFDKEGGELAAGNLPFVGALRQDFRARREGRPR